MAAPSPRPDLGWRLSTFAELGATELYDALALRQRVFVLEQCCLFGDIDGRDPIALHLLGRDESDTLVAYARLFTPAESGAAAVLGRVVVALEVRGCGVGRRLVAEALSRLRRAAPGAAVRIAAQEHLRDFYASFGFMVVSARYLEDDIWHVDMEVPAVQERSGYLSPAPAEPPMEEAR